MIDWVIIHLNICARRGCNRLVDRRASTECELSVGGRRRVMEQALMKR